MKEANYAPMYCALYPQLAEIARSHGYALAIHGSLGRDMDLICIPWVEAPSSPQVVVDAITSKFHIREVGGPPTEKMHGRLAFSISIGFGECFIDLSFMPTKQAGRKPNREATENVLREEFEQQHKGRNLSRHHLRGTYTSPPIAALWNQHVKTSKWLSRLFGVTTDARTEPHHPDSDR